MPRSYIAFLLLFLSQQLFARDVIGEKANYQLDRSSSRTSSMAQSGSLNSEVIEYLPNDARYNLKNDCKIKIQFMGTYSGTSHNPIPEELFTAEWLERLRAGEIFESDAFKARHLGYKDARNMDGHSYNHCDEVLIYDINMNAGGFGGSCVQTALERMAESIAKLNGKPFNRADLEDLEGRILINQDAIPVIGAAKIDLKGKYNGMNLKVGADYIQ